MKRSIYFVAALVFAACAREEAATDFTDGVALQVNAAIDAAATRAVGTAWAEGDPIGISTTTTPATATDYANVCYKLTSGRFVAESADEAIYFQDAQPVTFRAYYPWKADADYSSVTLTAADQTAENQPDVDFLFADGATASKKYPTVNFTGSNAFRHCMTQVSIKFSEGDDVDLDGLLTGYTLSGLYMTGSFDTGTGVAVAASGTADLTMALADVTTTAGNVYTTDPLIVFPQTTTAIGLAVTVKNHATDTEAQTYTATLVVPSVNAQNGLQAGYRYVFPVVVTKTGLTVGTAEIADWKETTAGGSTATM